jgi:hypothetical protein
VASLASVILSALTFAVFSVLLPIYLLIQVSTTPTAKLYDAMRTLLSLGPLYNIYAQGNQLYQALRFVASLATGIAIGAGQKNGTAQAVVLLVIEIAFGLVTTIWQPWRPGAGMVVPGFLFTVIRIASTVLLLIMSPAVSYGKAFARHHLMTSLTYILPTDQHWSRRIRLDSLHHSHSAGCRFAGFSGHAPVQGHGRSNPTVWQRQIRRLDSRLGWRTVRSIRWLVASESA